MLNDNTTRKLAEAVRHRWPGFSTETPQESSCTGAGMRFPCALICSTEDKEQLCLLQRKKRNIRTATCSRFRSGDVPEEGSQFPSLANNEQADWIFWHIDIILHVVKIKKKKIYSLYQKTLVSRKASIIYLVLLDLYRRHSGYYFQINSISVSKHIFFLSLDINRI